jgi:hypothetical protein
MGEKTVNRWGKQHKAELHNSYILHERELIMEAGIRKSINA